MEELEDPIQMRHPVMGMVKDGEFATIWVYIREISCGFSFSKLPMSNRKTIDVYKDELKTHIYIKAFTDLHGHNEWDNEVRWWIESQSSSCTHVCNFLSFNSEVAMVRRGQQALRLSANAYQFPWLECNILVVMFVSTKCIRERTLTGM